MDLKVLLSFYFMLNTIALNIGLQSEIEYTFTCDQHNGKLTENNTEQLSH